MELEELKEKWESLKDVPGWKPKPKSAGVKWLEKKISELEVIEPKEEVKEKPKQEIKPIEVPKPKQAEGFEFNGETYAFKKGKEYAIISTKRNSVSYFGINSIRSIIKGSYWPFEIPKGQVYPDIDLSNCKTCGNR